MAPSATTHCDTTTDLTEEYATRQHASPPARRTDTATNHGLSPDKAITLSLFIAKVHGLAVAEHTRGQGIATTLLKRTWQVYEQLGYLLLYGSYEADRDLSALYQTNDVVAALLAQARREGEDA